MRAADSSKTELCIAVIKEEILSATPFSANLNLLPHLGVGLIYIVTRIGG